MVCFLCLTFLQGKPVHWYPMRGAGGCLPESGVLQTSPWVIGTPLLAQLLELLVNVTPHRGSRAAEEAGDSPGSPPCVGAL